MATATTSRYGTTVGSSQGGAQDTKTTGSQTTNGTSTTNQSGTVQTDSTNMDSSSLAALQALIAQLSGGGTQQMANERATRQGEVKQLQADRSGYSKEAAFGDAQGLMAQTLRSAMEKLLPSINNAALAGGTSQSSLRALLLQDAATRSAESASAQGLNAAVNYGNISNGMSGILEALTRPDNTAVNALLNALTIAKGAVTSSTQNSSGTSTTNSSQTTDSNQLIDVGNNGSSSSSSGGSKQNNGGMVSYGPIQTELEALLNQSKAQTGSSAGILDQLNGNNAFQSYTP